ncbi:hypothetical protein DPMN_030048 [Dreissena polymorpha]|uniref:Uncharacterized protein n=1 Tax=Dreissena polymorpha TaxID=45954 RepID=A0A9D4RHY2_DREPO|nr:hypothetical protein DPMN_030048 [Dreissena polymorpha]
MNKKTLSTLVAAKTPTVAPQETSKRAAISPLDQAEFKKTRTFSTESLPDAPDASLQISLSDSDIAKIADALSKSFEPQKTSIVEQVADRVVQELHEKISTIECENKSLRKTVAELTIKVHSLEDNEDRQNKYS